MEDIDHVVVAIGSLDSGITELRQLSGVTAMRGLAGSETGTENAVIGLGRGRYLLLIAPRSGDSSTPRTRVMARYPLLQPVGFAVRVRDADSALARAIGRGLPGGVVRSGHLPDSGGPGRAWRSVRPWGRYNRSTLPAFVEWRGGRHPSMDAPPGCTLISLRLGSPDAEVVRGLLDSAAIRVPVDSASLESLSIQMDCPLGRVELPMRNPTPFTWPASQPPPAIAGVALGMTRPEVESVLGKPAHVATVADSITLLVYGTRPATGDLQVGLWRRRVIGVSMFSWSAGEVLGAKVGMHARALLPRLGIPAGPGGRGVSWPAGDWEIIAITDEALYVTVLQLRRRVGLKMDCRWQPDSIGTKGGFVCDMALPDH